MQNKNQKLKVKSQKLHNILMEIVKRKKEDIKKIRIKNHDSIRQAQDKSRSKGKKNIIHDSLFMIPGNEIALIAEIKFASPTNPNLGSTKELLDRTKIYEEAGADAISIITEQHFFKGDVKFISQVKKEVTIPILQKDFVIDERQIYQAKEIGSDALLLIARLVDAKTLQHFVDLCFAEGIEPVVEINNEEDLEKAIKTKTKIIAVNARDLETFNVDITRACKLMKKIPNTFIKLGFSGITSNEEVEQYKKAGAKGVLVGTSLMKAKNIKTFLSSLRANGESAAISNKIASSQAPRNDNIVKVKICGIRTLANARTAILSGADFLGFNFVQTSKRKISLETAKKIIYELRTVNYELRTKFVGIFQNQPVEEVNEIAEVLVLDFVQLHGEEDDEYLRKMNYPYIKKMTTKNKFMIPDSCFMILDRKVQGEGEMVDLEKAKEIAKMYKTFFSGGLTPENVAEVVKKVKPFAVDVAGGIETDGKIDSDKVKRFIENAKGGSFF